MGSWGSRGRSTGPRESRGRLTRSQEIKGWAYRFPGGQGVDLQGPRGSRARPTGSQGFKGEDVS